MSEFVHDGAAVYDEAVLYHRSFGFVEIGEPVLFNGLASFMALGLNQRSFAEKYGIKGGSGLDDPDNERRICGKRKPYGGKTDREGRGCLRNVETGMNRC